MEKFKGLVVDLRPARLDERFVKDLEYWDEAEGVWKPVVSRPEDTQPSADHRAEDDGSTHYFAARKGDSHPPENCDSPGEGHSKK